MQRKILSRFTSHTRQAIDRAQIIADSQGMKAISNKHLLYGVAFEEGSVGQVILEELGFEKNLPIDFPLNPRIDKPVPFSAELKETFRQAVKLASRYHYPYIGTEHLVHAILKSGNKDIQKIMDRFLAQTKKQNKRHKISLTDLGQLPDFTQSMNINLDFKNNTHTKSNPLNKFATNLNFENKQKNVHPIIGRTDEIDRIINTLLRKNKNNPVLVGEPGVGKTAAVSALAQKINLGDVPIQLADKVIYELDLGLLLSGTTFRGEFEQRMKDVINYASQNEQVILFIDEIHNLMGTGNTQGSLDAANMLKPALAKGSLKLIGATTFDEYRRHIEKDAAFERRFQQIIISEPQEAETKKILKGIQKNYEEHHRVIISPEAIEAAVILSNRYINDRFLPDKAIDLIDEAQAQAKAGALSYDTTKKINRCLNQKKRIKQLKKKLIFNNKFKVASNLKKDEQELDEILETIATEQKRREKLIYLQITEDDIKKIVSRQTGIPLKNIHNNNRKEALTLNRNLAQKIVGQSQAIKTITNTIQRASSGINDPSRPLGSFIFLGPTGVGKTYFAKILAEILFKNPASFLRIDMSEFSEKHNVSKLIGAPAGYVGYEDGGTLTDKVRHNPYSLILFDEIEKAHPEALNVLLQILEDGILTDSTGRTVNFKNTIIILTSNVGAKSFTEEIIGFKKNSSVTAQIKSTVIEKLREILLPELANRIDNIIVFNPLTIANLTQIAKKEIKQLNQRLKESNLKISLDTDAYKFLARLSFDKKEGARLLRKNIEELIQTPLAEILLEKEAGEILTVRGKLKNKEIEFKSTKQPF
ncbi:MAG: ATP-dependent Clp protease ATP-binding subunit [Patescibacteria group bacterium]|nr:ATP-dependent Clp protease ATP-binding subunit [Patescibacteria group bacterium]